MEISSLDTKNFQEFLRVHETQLDENCDANAKN